jgi:hypothetical protein
MPRCDAFFEIHPYSSFKSEPSYAGYVENLKHVPKVYLQETEPDIPGSVVYPKDEMVDKYGPYFFTSSFSWMMALAIETMNALPAEEERVVGLWGIDCSSGEEYGLQRPGAHFFFMKMCEARPKIHVYCPPQSDLLHPPGLYGYVENDPWYQKQMARKREYEHAHGAAMTEVRIANEKMMRLAGSLDDIQWNLNTWAQRANGSYTYGTSC